MDSSTSYISKVIGAGTTHERQEKFLSSPDSKLFGPSA